MILEPRRAEYEFFEYTIIPSDPDPSEGCPADLDGDLIVGVGDVLILLGEFGCSSGCTADLDADGNVTISDVLNLLGLFGESCP